jgi:hypothetical protein
MNRVHKASLRPLPESVREFPDTMILFFPTVRAASRRPIVFANVRLVMKNPAVGQC